MNPNENSAIITSVDLIKKMIELLRLSKIEDWTEEYMKDNPPRYYRFKQLEILFKLYDLGTFNDFLESNFIEKREIEQYEIIYQKVEKELNYDFREFGYRKHPIKRLFKTLWTYRVKISECIHFNDSVIEASGLYRYAYNKVEEMNNVFIPKLNIIDDILSLIISPESKTFLLKDLIEKYDYPDVDFEQIDFEWK